MRTAVGNLFDFDLGVDLTAVRAAGLDEGPPAFSLPPHNFLWSLYGESL